VMSPPILAVVANRLGGIRRPEPSRWRPFLDFGLPSVFGSVSQILNLRLDQMVMVAFLLPRDLGLYVAAVAWSGAVIPAVSAIGSVLLPQVASLSPDLKARALGRGARLAGVLALLMGGALTAITPWCFPLIFGEAFRPAITVAMILPLATAISGVNSVIEDGLRGLGFPKLPLLGELLGLVTTCTLLYFLVPRFGILGAALASLLAYSTTLLALISLSARKIGASMSTFCTPTREDLPDMIRSAIHKVQLGPHWKLNWP
jgi:O-antigen/teichoic acid export membrane protein